MGCDGGTIPTRDELVRVKKKPEQKDKTADLAAKWKLCAITQEPLRHPIMACELGRLYNKESVLELLLDRSKFECASSFSHIRGLKDVKELKLTENPAYKKNYSEKGDGYIDTNIAQYICPVVGVEMNGKHKFSYLLGCGCALSERAFKEVKGQVCHKCGKQFKEEDLIVLNGTDDEVDALYEKMDKRRQQAKLDKKAKKAGKHKAAEAAGSSSQEASGSGKQARLEAKTEIKSGATSSKLTNGKHDKHSKIANGKSYIDSKAKTASIQKDPKSSEVYKSLFTSSDAHKDRPTAHWVTYNPFY